MNRTQRSVLRAIFLSSVMFGLVFGGLAILATGQMDYFAAAAGFCFGALGCMGIMTFELLIKPRTLGIMALGMNIILSALFETAFLAAMFEASVSAFDTFNGPASRLQAILAHIDIPTALAILACSALVLQFLLSAAKIMGGRTLLRFLFGYYRRPRATERFVVYVSLADYQSMFDRFGQNGYLDYLNAFYIDLEKAALNCGGELYQHLGDGAILHWRGTPGEANNACIAFVFRLRKLLVVKDDWYQANFHQSPRFRASIHFGPVWMNEAGWAHRHMLCSGPVLTTLAKLDSACNRMKENFLVSDAAMDHMVLPAGTRIHRTINARLRDEEESWRIFALEQIPI